MTIKPGYRQSSQRSKARRTHRSPHGLTISSWSALEEYLRAKPEALEGFTCSSKDEARLRALLDRYSLKAEIALEAEGFEGFSAAVKVSYGDEDAFFEAAPGLVQDFIVACDHITDTRNLGAIARTAAFFGIKRLLLPKDRQAPISSAALGVAQGAFATVEPIQVTNLGRALMRLKECGYWIICADMDGAPLSALTQNFAKTVLVLGSEDKGLSANILNKSDVKVSIPSVHGNLESLNVSVAAGILIHALHEPFKGN